MWGMFSQCFFHYHLAVPLLVMLCSFTFLPLRKEDAPSSDL